MPPLFSQGRLTAQPMLNGDDRRLRAVRDA